MRRLLVVSLALLAVIVLAIWLLLPMFVFPKESTIEECDRCADLVTLVPQGAGLVVVAPRGGTSLFELGRRIVPPRELSEKLPAPGLLAIGFGDSPVVVWQDEDGRPGAAVAPKGLRRLLVRVATYGYGSDSFRWKGDVLTFGRTGDGGVAVAALDSLRGVRGHFFAVHQRPAGRSVGRLERKALVIRTLPDAAAGGPTRAARHPEEAIFSLSVPDLGPVIEPVEKIVPMKTTPWRGRGGQIVIYGLAASGLLPSARGVLLVEGKLDAREALERTVPRVEGMTRDSRGEIAGAEVFRRETLGVTVDAATRDGWLALAFDGTSMARWLGAPGRLDEVPAVWSFSGEPAALSAAIDELMDHPGSHLLGSSQRRTLRRLGEVAGVLRNAIRVRSQLVPGTDGLEIESRVEW